MAQLEDDVGRSTAVHVCGGLGGGAGGQRGGFAVCVCVAYQALGAWLRGVMADFLKIMQTWCGLQSRGFQDVDMDPFYMGADQCARPHTVVVLDSRRSVSHDGFCDLYNRLLYGG